MDESYEPPAIEQRTVYGLHLQVHPSHRQMLINLGISLLTLSSNIATMCKFTQTILLIQFFRLRTLLRYPKLVSNLVCHPFSSIAKPSCAVCRENLRFYSGYSLMFHVRVDLVGKTLIVNDV